MAVSPFPRLRFLLSCLALLLILAACDLSGPGPGPAPTPLGGLTPTASRATVAPGPTTPPNVPRGGTLTVRIARDVTTLNPFFVERQAGRDDAAAQVTGLIFNGLTRLDNKLRPVPDLAESWDVAPDGLSLVFKLRPGVKWQDGSPMTADDVIWTYNTWLNLTTTTTTLQYHLRESVLQIGPGTPPQSTVRFFLRRPYAPILADLAAPILPKHILGAVPLSALQASDFNFKPVGTGPFMFSSHKDGENVILTANPNYYTGPPHLNSVAFLVAPDAGVAAKALTDGTLLLGELPQSQWQDLGSRPGISGSLSLNSWPDSSYDFVAFNSRANQALGEVRLRQAWALALDKPLLVRAATQGAGLPLWTTLNPASWAYAPDTPKLNNDPARARKLLADAGWRDTNGDGIADKGGELLKISIFVRADDPTRRRAAEAMGPPLTAVGISTTVAAVDFNSVIQAKIDPLHDPPFDFHAMIMGWNDQLVDPDEYLFFHSSQIPSRSNLGGLNYVGYRSPQYDDLSRRARAEYDYTKRAELYAEIQKLLATDLPYYPLWAPLHYMAMSKRVQGPMDLASPRYLWNVEDWWMTPGP